MVAEALPNKLFSNILSLPQTEFITDGNGVLWSADDAVRSLIELRVVEAPKDAMFSSINYKFVARSTSVAPITYHRSA